MKKCCTSLCWHLDAGIPKKCECGCVLTKIPTLKRGGMGWIINVESPKYVAKEEKRRFEEQQQEDMQARLDLAGTGLV